MAANLLVRRSTAGLLRLVRSQAATFATWLPSRSDIRQLPVHRDEVLKFKEAFSLPSTGSLVINAKDYCMRTLDYKEPPRMVLKHWLELNEVNKIEARKRYKCHLTPAVMREIEEDIMKIYQAKCDPDGRSTEM